MRKTRLFDGVSSQIRSKYQAVSMEQGLSLTKEFDRFITRESFECSQEKTGRYSCASLKSKSSSSKRIMKNIFKNQLWNDLIDRQYNRSLSTTHSRPLTPVKPIQILNKPQPAVAKLPTLHSSTHLTKQKRVKVVKKEISRLREMPQYRWKQLKWRSRQREDYQPGEQVFE